MQFFFSFFFFQATCLPLVDKVCLATCLLVVWVGVALHQLSHTYCENVGAALWLLADGRGRVGGSDGLDAHLPLTYAGGGGNRGGVVAERTPTIGRLGSRERLRGTDRIRGKGLEREFPSEGVREVEGIKKKKTINKQVNLGHGQIWFLLVIKRSYHELWKELHKPGVQERSLRNSNKLSFLLEQRRDVAGSLRWSGSYLVNVNRRDGCRGDWWVAGRVGERFARTDWELLLFPHGHDLLGNWRRGRQRQRRQTHHSRLLKCG